MANFPESAMQPICELQGHYLNTEDFVVRPPQRTFPTPSELLIDMATAKESEISAEPASSKKPETARKARRRAMARSIGFEPTDPDSISSHDKKRLHLECLEQYVIHLHHQIKLLGLDPEPLECALKPHELSCRSMRILLIHMENITRSLNERIVSEEEKFIVLRDTVWKLDQSMTRNDRNAQGSNSQISSLG
ncbi:hypothetical protein BD779DRAFT_29216 [Infundibulicybe gibba]|nr:hypothetical protein BD779DRAFT_29216 [Infundibulicybe gibba]